jgi:hypothetical protein
MDELNRKTLDQFGQLMMSEVRDPVCSVVDHLMTGEAPGGVWANMRGDFQKLKLSPERALVIAQLVVEAVDQTIFHFLRFLDEKEISVYFRGEDGEIRDLTKISDGLYGEPLTDCGWIARFSKYKSALAD